MLYQQTKNITKKYYKKIKIYSHIININILFKFTRICKFRNRFQYLFVRKRIRIFLKYPSWLLSYWCSYLTKGFKKMFDVFSRNITKNQCAIMQFE